MDRVRRECSRVQFTRTDGQTHGQLLIDFLTRRGVDSTAAQHRTRYSNSTHRRLVGDVGVCSTCELSVVVSDVTFDPTTMGGR